MLFVEAALLPTSGHQPGEVYIDSTGALYYFDGRTWTNGLGPQGPAGPGGPPGPTGPAGPQGTVLLPFTATLQNSGKAVFEIVNSDPWPGSDSVGIRGAGGDNGSGVLGFGGTGVKGFSPNQGGVGVRAEVSNYATGLLALASDPRAIAVDARGGRSALWLAVRFR